VLGGASGSRIIDLTASSDKSLRKGKRDPRKVRALVLHQMACCFKPKDPLAWREASGGSERDLRGDLCF
jgi:hypothetical protein